MQRKYILVSYDVCLGTVGCCVYHVHMYTNAEDKNNLTVLKEKQKAISDTKH